MKTIYNFEMHAPPHLTEAMLQARIEARKKHLQTLLVLLSGVLMQVAIVLLGALAAPRSPAFSFICLVYVLISTAGGSVIAVVFVQKGGKLHAV